MRASESQKPSAHSLAPSSQGRPILMLQHSEQAEAGNLADVHPETKPGAHLMHKDVCTAAPLLKADQPSSKLDVASAVDSPAVATQAGNQSLAQASAGPDSKVEVKVADKRHRLGAIQRRPLVVTEGQDLFLRFYLTQKILKLFTICISGICLTALNSTFGVPFLRSKHRENVNALCKQSFQYAVCMKLRGNVTYWNICSQQDKAMLL